MADALSERLAEADLLFLDPPRRGLDPSVVATILDTPPERVLYLSCDPPSLARDLAPLVNGGPYIPTTVQPFDFFPNTTHVETLVVLERRG